MNKNKTWLPLLVAFAIAFFIYLGVRLESLKVRNEQWSNAYNATGIDGANKLNYLFQLLNSNYVDSLSLDSLTEMAIPSIIEELDPHSVYIPAKDLKETNEQLEGSFSGIGVQFNIQNDTVMIISVISGGPSEKAGLIPGDRIVSINDSAFVGSTVNNSRVMKTLRGEKGSIVKVGIRRASADEELKFDIERGDIPVNSVIARYVMDKNIGYIKVDNFGRNTYNEFYTSLVKLSVQGATNYIVDLRGNSGGYMEICCRMLNEFLNAGDLIVYTEGKSVQRSDIRADGSGSFKQVPVVVLIDEWSASASEIFSGAIQDNDRGMVVGRRSFGKGLVQQQFEMADGSALRITIARYHTPSGRCIQKAYKMGDNEDYSKDLLERYERGEFYSKDSIHQDDNAVYQTVGGRTVYGGGGIMPDIFIPSDTTGITPYYNKIINAGLCYSFAFRYSDNHREQLSAYPDFESLEQYLKSQYLVDSFAAFAASKVPPVSSQINKSRDNIERIIIAYIMRQVKDEDYFYREFNSDDPSYLEAVRLLKEGKAYPEKTAAE